MSLIPTNRHNPCPICEDNTGKCRQSREDSDYLQCMSYADSVFGEVINGYKCLGSTKDGLWGQFRIDNSQEYSDQQRQEWKCKNQARAAAKAKAEADLRANALPIDERDKAIRKLAAHFGLSKKHRDDLNHRGLSDKAIEKNLYFSITPNQKVPYGISSNLAGIKFGEIRAAGIGYACVSFNPQGKATGWQVRLDNAIQSKYRWASGCHLSNGELPITLSYPIELKHSFIGVCEGINKATIAASRRGQIFIGAASANFAASPEQLKEYLEIASSHLGGNKRVEFAADAGSINNPYILANYKRSWELIESFGYEVLVSWWSQIDKTHPDIDELSDLNQIQYLTTEEFLLLANPKAERNHLQKTYINPIEELPKTGFNIIRNSQNELLEVFDALKTKRGQEWLQLRKFTPDATIHSKHFDYNFKPDENLAIKSGLGTGKSYFTNAKWLKNPDEGAVLGGYRNCLNEQFCTNGEKLNGRAWHQIQADLKGTQDLSLISDSQSRIAGAVDSWLYFSAHHFNTKKAVFDEIESVAKHLNQSNTAVSYYRDTIKSRVSDALQNSSANLIADGNLRDFTVDYIAKLSGRKLTKILNTYTGNRGKVYLYNGSSRKRQATEQDVIDKLAEKVGNWITFDHKPDDYSKMHRMMMDLPTDIPMLILSDSQKKCEAWDRQLSELGRKVFRLDSTTSQSDLGKQFLRNPKDFILTEKIDTVILSPSAESGISIELADELERAASGYFKYEFAFFFGISTTDVQSQFLGRNRDPYTTKFVYVQTRSLPTTVKVTDEQNSFNVYEMWIDTIKECASLSLQGLEDGQVLELALEKIKQQLLDPHLQYESKLLLKESFEKAYPRLCLEYALREAGWQVTVVQGREDDLSDLKEISQQIEKEKAKAIFDSQNITPSEADKLAKKLNKTPEERNQIKKAGILNKLPGIENKVVNVEVKAESLEVIEQIEQSPNNRIIEVDSQPYEGKDSLQEITEKGVKLVVEKPAFDLDFINKILHKDRNFIPRIESQFLLKNPEICKLLQQQKWHKKLDLLTDPDKTGSASLPISHYRSKWLEVSTLYEMGIEFFFNNSWNDQTPEAIAFWEKGKSSTSAKRIGVKHEESVTTYIGKVLDRYGLKTSSKQLSRADGTRYREYSLATTDLLSQAVLECVSQRVLAKVSEFQFDWKKVVKNWGSKVAQLLTGQVIQAAHLPPNNSIKASVQVCSENQEDLASSNIATSIELLAESLSTVESVDEFKQIAEWYEPTEVSNAIAASATLPLRSKLRGFYEALWGAITYPWGE